MNQTPCLLSMAYWPPIHYIREFYHYQNIAIEQWETYPKQTYRNRCKIYGPNGIQSLIVPVEQGSFHKIISKDIKIAYDTKWQKNHIKTIDAAYRSCPFFEYYIDDVMPFYEKQYIYLIDMNTDILMIVLKWLKLKNQISKTNQFEKSGNFVDNRNSIHPKKEQVLGLEAIDKVTYIQGFEQRHGFIPNLSVLDLVFNLGSEAAFYFKKD